MIPKRLEIVGDFPEEATEFIAAAMPDNVPTRTRKALFLYRPENVDSSDKNGNYPTSGKKTTSIVIDLWKFSGHKAWKKQTEYIKEIENYRENIQKST